jgi:hypothetical protein
MKCQEKEHFFKKVVLFVQKIKNGFFFKSCQKDVKKLSKGCQKVVQKVVKSCQKVVKSCQKIAKSCQKKLSKSCQKSCQKVCQKLPKSCFCRGWKEQKLRDSKLAADATAYKYIVHLAGQSVLYSTF